MQNQDFLSRTFFEGVISLCHTLKKRRKKAAAISWVSVKKLSKGANPHFLAYRWWVIIDICVQQHHILLIICHQGRSSVTFCHFLFSKFYSSCFAKLSKLKSLDSFKDEHLCFAVLQKNSDSRTQKKKKKKKKKKTENRTLTKKNSSSMWAFPFKSKLSHHDGIPKSN